MAIDKHNKQTHKTFQNQQRIKCEEKWTLQAISFEYSLKKERDNIAEYYSFEQL